MNGDYLSKVGAASLSDTLRLGIDTRLNDYFRKHFESTAALAEAIRKNQQAVESALGGTIRQIAENVEKHRVLVRPLLMQAEDLRRQIDIGRLSIQSADLARLTEAQTKLSSFATMRSADFSRFVLPSKDVLAEISARLTADKLLPTTRLVELPTIGLSAFSKLRNPWMDSKDALISMKSISELASIGRVVGRADSYGGAVSDALRRSLGDWRDTVTINPEAQPTISERSALYAERGLNPDLTDFPEESFNESLDALEIRVSPPPLLAVYGPPVPAEQDAELEDGLLRNNQAHDWLQRFETQIRRFIDNQMTSVYGPDWLRSKLPNNMYDRWLDKQAKDPNRDRHSHPIVYADFTDYELLITRSDVFREVFQPFFGRVERFRESMFRLSLPRVEISHGRIITQDDALFFWVEIRRLMAPILRNTGQ